MSPHQTPHPEAPIWLSDKRNSDPLCRVVLVEPLIPENSGNIGRTCVATGAELHFVGPLGFELNESRIRRAGLDYWPHLAAAQHSSFAHFVRWSNPQRRRVFCIETFGERSIFEADFCRGDWLIFGKETTGLTREQVSELAPAAEGGEGGEIEVFRLPMPGETRSLNLSNAVAIAVYELLRQTSMRQD